MGAQGEHFDEESGMPYYVNSQTGSFAEKPAGFDQQWLEGANMDGSMTQRSRPMRHVGPYGKNSLTMNRV